MPNTSYLNVPLFWTSSTFALCALGVCVITTIYGRSQIHRLWVLFNLNVMAWGLCLALIARAGHDYTWARYYWNVAAIFGFAIAPTFCQFVMAYTNHLKKKFILLSYAHLLIIWVSVFLGVEVFPISLYNDQFYYPNHNASFFFAMLGWLAESSMGLYLLSRSVKKSRASQKIEYKYALVGLCIGIVGGGAAHWLTVYRVNFVNPSLNISVTLYLLFITYAIFRHKIFGLDPLVKKSLVYSVMVGLVTCIYFLSIYVLDKFFQSSIGYNSALSLIFVLVAVIFAEPLRQRIQKTVDAYFYQGNLETLSTEKQKFFRELEKQDKLKAVATLSAGMAHEIKNPLTTIKTFAEYLPSKYDDKTFRSNFSSIVTSEIDRVNRIVMDLLEFSKPKDTQKHTVDLSGVLDQTLELLSSALLKKKIQLMRSYDQKLYTHGDQDKIKQVFLNILMNAIEAATAESGVIKISAQADGGWVVFVFEDNGPGIAKDKLSKIFDPFYTTKDTGTGLGLAVAHGIVKAHGGKIEAVNGEVSGCKILIRLPKQV